MSVNMPERIAIKQSRIFKMSTLVCFSLTFSNSLTEPFLNINVKICFKSCFVKLREQQLKINTTTLLLQVCHFFQPSQRLIRL